MHRKNYEKCDTVLELICCVIQNAIITFMKDETILNSLETGNYLYHSSLNNALKDNVHPRMPIRAAFEIARYCQEKDDCQGKLFQLIVEEITIVIPLHGQRIHELERQKHGRNFTNKTHC